MLDTLRGAVDQLDPEYRLDHLTTVGQLAGIGYNVLFGITFSVSFIMMLFGAFRYVLSSGDPKLIEKAYRTMFWSAIAMLSAVLAISIKDVVVQVTDVNSPDIEANTPVNF